MLARSGTEAASAYIGGKAGKPSSKRAALASRQRNRSGQARTELPPRTARRLGARTQTGRAVPIEDAEPVDSQQPLVSARDHEVRLLQVYLERAERLRGIDKQDGTRSPEPVANRFKVVPPDRSRSSRD